jgi:hypothetical protein
MKVIAVSLAEAEAALNLNNVDIVDWEHFSTHDREAFRKTFSGVGSNSINRILVEISWNVKWDWSVISYEMWLSIVG